MRRISRLARSKSGPKSIQTPTLILISNVHGPSGNGPYSSIFTPINFTGIHESSDWECYLNANLSPSELVYTTNNDPSALRMINSDDILSLYYSFGDMVLYVRVRHRSQNMVSDWSPTFGWYVPGGWF